MQSQCKHSIAPGIAAATLIAGGILMPQASALAQTTRTNTMRMSSVAMGNMTSMKMGSRTIHIERNMKAVLDTLKSLGPKPIERLTPQQARRQPGPPDAVKALLQKRGMSTAPQPVGSVVDKYVPGPNGNVRVRVYKPRNTSSNRLPVLVYFHGGGFVIASVTAYDSSARALANAAGCMVVSVGYRYAPEHRLPAPHEDSYAVTQYMMKNAAAWGGDPNRVAVGGESAGGSLATAMCIMARDRGERMPVHQLLVYPYVDISRRQLNYPSAIRYAQAKPLNRPMLAWFARYALPYPAFGNNLLASPLPRANVRRLPSATIVQAEIDPLLSQGSRYADKLRAAGVPVRQRFYRGVTHEFFGMGAVVPAAKDAVNFAAQGLKSAFNR